MLAVEPDLRQAALLTAVIREQVRAELVLVDSRDAAIIALGGRTPDVVLLTALLSPRDEEELVAHLRSLPGSDHVQTHTIPQLASGDAPDASAKSGGLLSKFRRKKEVAHHPGCDPSMFADEVREFVARALELKSEAAAHVDLGIAQPLTASSAAGVTDLRDRDAAAGDSAWSSPFEWRRSDPPRGAPDPHAGDAVVTAPAHDTPVFDEADTTAPLSGHDDSYDGAAAMAAAEARMLEEMAAEGERRQREADEAAERERVRLEAEAALEQERLRLEAEEAAERERLRVEAEAALQQERLRVEAEEAAERERLRLEAEAALEQERLRLEAEKAAERERLRLEAEAALEQERMRLEAEQAAERERLRLEAQAALEQERLRLEAEQAAERERLRLEAQATLEQERLRLEAEQAAERERLRVEAEAKAEQQRLEAQAAAERERLRIEVEAALEQERLRVAAEEAAERARLRLDADADAERKHLRMEADAAAERERRRAETAASAERERAMLEEAAMVLERMQFESEAEPPRRARAAAPQAEAGEAGDEISLDDELDSFALEADLELNGNLRASGPDPFAEFREEHDEPNILLRIPISPWARQEAATATAAPSTADDLYEIMAGLSLPADVGAVSYARGCRIRRVRVPAAADTRTPGAPPVILSKRSLEEMRVGR